MSSEPAAAESVTEQSANDKSITDFFERNYTHIYEMINKGKNRS